MRHRKKGRKLNRTASHKKALMRNLANQLFEHKEIRTTTAKAKEARSTIERLITYAKKGDLHHRRLAFSFLRQKATIKMLFDEIAPSFSDRQGGYTRIVKLGRRLGDGAPMSLLQLVGFETLGETVKKDKKKKSRKKAEKAIPEKEEAAAEVKTETSAEPEKKTDIKKAAEETSEPDEEPVETVEKETKETAEDAHAKKSAEPEQKTDEMPEDGSGESEEPEESKDREESDPDKIKS